MADGEPNGDIVDGSAAAKKGKKPKKGKTEGTPVRTVSIHLTATHIQCCGSGSGSGLFGSPGSGSGKITDPDPLSTKDPRSSNFLVT